MRSFVGADKILETRHPEPVLHFAFFSNVARLAFELKQVAWLTIEHVANLGQGFEPHTANLAGPDKRQVLFRQPDPLGEFFRAHFAPCEHDVES